MPLTMGDLFAEWFPKKLAPSSASNGFQAVMTQRCADHPRMVHADPGITLVTHKGEFKCAISY